MGITTEPDTIAKIVKSGQMFHPEGVKGPDNGIGENAAGNIFTKIVGPLLPLFF